MNTITTRAARLVIDTAAIKDRDARRTMLEFKDSRYSAGARVYRWLMGKIVAGKRHRDPVTEIVLHRQEAIALASYLDVERIGSAYKECTWKPGCGDGVFESASFLDIPIRYEGVNIEHAECDDVYPPFGIRLTQWVGVGEQDEEPQS